MNPRKSVLRALGAFVTLAFASVSAVAAWERQAIDAGGIPGAKIATSTATSRTYIPLLQDRALAVFDGASAPARMELAIKPTAVGYSAVGGRLFVAGMFDNAVIVIDEASGSQTRIAAGSHPDNILVDDVRGKVYVSNWGGITGQGGITVIDTATLASRTVPLGGAVTAMAHDAQAGTVVVTVAPGPATQDFLAALDAQGNLVARLDAGYSAYSLAVDSRDGRVYVGGLSGSPLGGATVSRVLSVFSLPGLTLVSRREWTSQQTYHPLTFLVDPAQPGLYIGSGESTVLTHVDASGGMQSWQLPLGETTLQDGRRVTNGIFGLDADPANGRIFASSPVGSLVAEFNPVTGATELVGIPGAVGFDAVHFLGSGTVLVTDAGNDRQFTLLKRANEHPLRRLRLRKD